MKHGLVKRSLITALAVALGLVSGSTFAAGIATTPDPAIIAPGGNAAVAIAITGDDQTTAVTGALEYDTVQFNATAEPAPGVTCAVNDGFSPTVGRVALAVVSLAPLADQTVCTVTFTAVADAPEADYPLEFAEVVFGNSPGGDTTDNGVLTVALAPPEPPTVTFNPNGGDVDLTAPNGALEGSESNATEIDVTAVGGSGAGEGSYTCADPGAPFTVTNLANPNILVGSDPADISVTCTLDDVAVSDTMTCQRTGAVATPVDFTLNCPAGLPTPSPEYSSAPAPDSVLNCDGEPGSLTQTSITITNTGLAGPGSDLDYDCAVSGPGFSILSGASDTLAVGEDATVTVQCTVPAEDAPAAEGDLDCTSNDAANSPANYPLSSIAATAPPPVPQPNVVPASSLWSQLSLIGLLAALGLLVVGIRRNH